MVSSCAHKFEITQRDGFTNVVLAPLIRRPIPFKAKFTPRFPEAAAMLELERESHGLPAFQRKA